RALRAPDVARSRDARSAPPTSPAPPAASSTARAPRPGRRSPPRYTRPQTARRSPHQQDDREPRPAARPEAAPAAGAQRRQDAAPAPRLAPRPPAPSINSVSVFVDTTLLLRHAYTERRTLPFTPLLASGGTHATRRSFGGSGHQTCCSVFSCVRCC